MAQSAERIEKFFSDADGLISKAGKAEDPKKGKPLCTELEKLAKWLQKHQDDSVGDGAKDKLLITLQKYYKWMKGLPAVPEAVRDRVAGAMEVYLMLPEGKLTTGKTKKQVLKWLEESRGDGAGAGDASAAAPRRTVDRLVMDARKEGAGAVLTLMTGEGDVDVVVRDAAVGDAIVAAFDEGATLNATVDAATNEFVSYTAEED